MKENYLGSSRYSSVPCYLSDQSERFNDIPFDIDENVYQTLLKHGLCLKEKIRLFFFYNLFERLSINISETFC